MNSGVAYNEPLADRSIVACPNCDLLQRLPTFADGASARCPRCAEELWRHRTDSLNRTLALAISAAMLYIVANTVPMLGLTIVGRAASTTVIGGAQHLWDDGRETVAALVFFTAVIAPALQISFMLAIVLGARREPAPRWVGTLLRHNPHDADLEHDRGDDARRAGRAGQNCGLCDGDTRAGAVRTGALVFVLAAMQASFDPREVWDRIAWTRRERRRRGGRIGRTANRREHAAHDRDAAGLQNCEVCGLLSRPAPGAEGVAARAATRS